MCVIVGVCVPCSCMFTDSDLFPYCYGVCPGACVCVCMCVCVCARARACTNSFVHRPSWTCAGC